MCIKYFKLLSWLSRHARQKSLVALFVIIPLAGCFEFPDVSITVPVPESAPNMPTTPADGGSAAPAPTTQSDAQAVADDQATLAITYNGNDSANSVTQNVGLATSGASGSNISWYSNTLAIISVTGIVTRPAFGNGNATITLTATITKGIESLSKDFTVTVIETPQSNTQAVAADTAALNITYTAPDTPTSVTQNIGLTVSGSSGTSIGWTSSNTAVITTDGIVTRPAFGYGNVTVEMTTTISKGGVSDTKVFVLVVNEEIPLTITASGNINVTHLAGNQNDCAITTKPLFKLNMFMACMNYDATGAVAGIYVARSTTQGASWTAPMMAPLNIIANGSDSFAKASGNPSVAWDVDGNLYIAYTTFNTTNTTPDRGIIVYRSIDDGDNFGSTAVHQNIAPTALDPARTKPKIAVDTTTPEAGRSSKMIWIAYNIGANMYANGATVSGTTIGPFLASPIAIPNMNNCTYGDIAISPRAAGYVAVVCQDNNIPSNIILNISNNDPITNGFSAVSKSVSTTYARQNYPVDTDPSWLINAGLGLSFDRAWQRDLHSGVDNTSFGRLYMVYTNRPDPLTSSTNIYLKYLDNPAPTTPTTVLTDYPSAINTTGNSNFMPKIASNPLSGNVAICWHYAEKPAGVLQVSTHCAMATPIPDPIGNPAGTGMPTLLVSPLNLTISDGFSDPSVTSVRAGHYMGLTYYQGLVVPVWADFSNSTGDNPDGTANSDIYVTRISTGTSANEGQ